MYPDLTPDITGGAARYKPLRADYAHYFRS